MKNILNWLKSVVGDRMVALIIARLLTKENILKGVDYVLDIGENYAAGTVADWDDSALKAIRDALNVPEFDKK